MYTYVTYYMGQKKDIHNLKWVTLSYNIHNLKWVTSLLLYQGQSWAEQALRGLGILCRTNKQIGGGGHDGSHSFGAVYKINQRVGVAMLAH